MKKTVFAAIVVIIALMAMTAYSAIMAAQGVAFFAGLYYMGG